MSTPNLLSKATELFCVLTTLTKKQISLEERIANCKIVQDNSFKKATVKIQVLNELLSDFKYQFVNQPHFNPISEEIFDILFAIDEEYSYNVKILSVIKESDPELLLSKVTECKVVTDSNKIKAIVLKSIHQIEWTKTRIYLLENVLNSYKDNIKQVEKVIEWVNNVEIELLELERRAANSKEMSRLISVGHSAPVKNQNSTIDSQETLYSISASDMGESEASIPSFNSTEYPAQKEKLTCKAISKEEMDKKYFSVLFWMIFTISIKVLV
ncbi:hypothetical protein HK103_004833 [Boothiomyces macroporosus]|uniref:Uncharacterized protein n=1 Tax=Boothiomyces macroporosus TaxID=261099 RepID=A0AAD5Y5N7_9FUNG|nr:hypothetical protein HK103_004833 [Boothiomyces macroporosus]